jgi:transposase InsO family protein
LSIVTDAYSKKIMGYYVADNMNTESSVKALNMAIKKTKERGNAIDSSFRQREYCANDYQNTLNKKRNIGMTQNLTHMRML